MTSSDERSNFLSEQFARKADSHRVAASAPVEQKLRHLLELQKISAEMARISGRVVKEPWKISIPDQLE